MTIETVTTISILRCPKCSEVKVVLSNLLLAICGRILDDVLTVVHQGNLLGGGGVLSLLVVPDPDESWESEANPLVGVHPPHSRLVDRRYAQVSTLDLPHLNRLKPMVWLVTRVIVVISFGFVSQIFLEEGGVLGKVLVGETSANLANALVLFILWVIASKKEATVTRKEKV